MTDLLISRMIEMEENGVHRDNLLYELGVNLSDDQFKQLNKLLGKYMLESFQNDPTTIVRTYIAIMNTKFTNQGRVKQLLSNFEKQSVPDQVKYMRGIIHQAVERQFIYGCVWETFDPKDIHFRNGFLASLIKVLTKEQLSDTVRDNCRKI